MKTKLRTKYSLLENEVLLTLRKLVEDSLRYSKHISHCKCIKVNVFDYTELVIVNDSLTFIDNRGYHYSIYSECDIDDLIDIIEKY